MQNSRVRKLKYVQREDDRKERGTGGIYSRWQHVLGKQRCSMSRSMAFRTLIAFVSVALVIGIIIDELLDTRYVAQPWPDCVLVDEC